ncbi:MAG: hypothetical protein WAL50_16635 [Kineosporiaceae bacterium]
MRILAAVLPSAGALLFFVIGIRALLQADRRERAAAARYERAQENANGSSASPALASERSVEEPPDR